MRTAARLRSRRARCSSSRNGTREYTGTSSYTPSPKMKPRSSTGTRASSIGMNFPFRKTIPAAPLLEPEPQCIPRAAEKPRGRHRLQRDHRVLAERLALQRHAQVADARALGYRRDQRRQREQIGLHFLGLALGHADQQVAAEARLERRFRALPDLDLL